MAGIRIPISASTVLQNTRICPGRCGHVLRQCSGRHIRILEERAGANHERGASQQYRQKKPTFHNVSPQALGHLSLTLFGLQLALPDSPGSRKTDIPSHRLDGPRHDLDELTHSCVRRICRGIDSVYVIFSLLLSVNDPAIAGLKAGKKTPRQGFLSLPRIQILSSANFGRNPASMSMKKPRPQIAQFVAE